MKRLALLLTLLISSTAYADVDNPVCFGEEDGTPYVCGPYEVKFSNGTVTNNSGASVSVAIPPATTPGGSDTQVQFNDSGSFAGAPNLTYTITTNTTNTGTLNADGSAVFNESGADKDFRIEGVSEPNLLFTDASTQMVGVGTNSPGFRLHVVGSAQYMANDNFENNSNAAAFIGRKARGSLASPSAVQANDALMSLLARGWHSGAAFGTSNVAAIIFFANQGFTSGAQGTYMTFGTTPDGSTTRAERMRITAAGNVGIGGTAPLGKLHTFEENTGVRGAFFDQYTSDAIGSSTVWRKARGSVSSPSAVQSGDALGFFGFRGYNSGGAFPTTSTAYVEADATENFTSSAMGGKLLFGTTPNGSTTNAVRMIIDDTGEVIVGPTDSSLFASSDKLRMTNDGGAAISIYSAVSAATDRAGILTMHSRGTVASPTVSINDDRLGFIGFKGYDGTTMQLPALVEAYVDGVPSSGSVPARISFVTGTNATTRKERLKMSANGNVTINDDSEDIDVRIESDNEANMFVVDGGTSKIGVANASPAYTFDVTGSIRATGSISTADMAVTNLTDYAPIFATPTTKVLQSGTLGNAGQVLTSNGAGALPTFQNASAGLTAGVTTISGGTGTGILYDASGVVSEKSTLSFAPSTNTFSVTNSTANNGTLTGTMAFGSGTNSAKTFTIDQLPTYGSDSTMTWGAAAAPSLTIKTPGIDSGSAGSPVAIFQPNYSSGAYGILEVQDNTGTVHGILGGLGSTYGVVGGRYSPSGQSGSGFGFTATEILPFNISPTINSIDSVDDSITLGSTAKRFKEFWLSRELNVGSDLGGRLNIDGRANEIQLMVQGNATQTNPVVTIEQSDGTDIYTISNTGSLISTLSTSTVRANTVGTTGAFTGVNSSVGSIMLRDTDNAGWTECTALDGVLSCGTDADGVPDGTA